MINTMFGIKSYIYYFYKMSSEEFNWFKQIGTAKLSAPIYKFIIELCFWEYIYLLPAAFLFEGPLKVRKVH